MANIQWPWQQTSAAQLQGPIPASKDNRMAWISSLPGAAQLAGVTRAGGTPPTLGASGGSPYVMGQTGSTTNKTLIIWLVAFGVLVAFHVGGARIG